MFAKHPVTEGRVVPPLDDVKGPTMAKSQKRTSKEIRKPKAAKAKPGAAIAGASAFPVNTLMAKPKDRA